VKQCTKCGATETYKWYGYGKTCSPCYWRARDFRKREERRAYAKANDPIRRQRNRERLLAQMRDSYRAKPEMYKKNAKLRQERIKLATPAWVDKKALREFYKNKPLGMSVDHIVPIGGKNVCGLHVIWNLQYLTLEQNKRKHASVDFKETA
jgi:hypothetical protein